MPMNRKLYPKNWNAIALEVKQAAGWQCEECGRPCRQPGESVDNLALRLAELDPNENSYLAELYEEHHDHETGEWGYIPKPQRFTLTVAHLDHVPENCDRANLRAWCSVCHCRYDLKAMRTKKRLKAERLGQLTLVLEEVVK